MFGDYPTDGWRFWVFIAGMAALGLIGVVLVFAVGGHSG